MRIRATLLAAAVLLGCGVSKSKDPSPAKPLIAASTSPIVNGDFEAGSLTGWTTSGSTAAVTTAHSGTYAARLGSTNPTTDSSASQTFTVPTGGGTISFWYKVVCPDTVTYDWATVTLKDNTSNTTTTLLAKTCTNSGSWAQVTSAALTDGHSVTLTLSNHDDNYSGDATYTLYDDVVFTGSSTPPPPPPPSSGITNGDFELGTLAGWTTAGQTSVSTTAHGGTHSAMVGSTNPSTDSSISQTFSVPTGGGTLSFWYRVVCPDTVTYDWASATLKDNTAGTTTTLLSNTCSNSGSWAQVTSAALTAGHSMTLTLSNHDDNYSGDATYTLYDDVVLSGSAPPPPPANDFSVSVSPSSQTVAAGSSVAYTVATALTSGSAQSVSLTVSGLPAGVTGTFNPASVTAGSSSTLTLAAASSAASATATFTVTGTATSGSHGATAGVQVTGSSPPPGTGVGNNGGTVDHLYFAVVGDTRPGSLDGTSSYPTAIITKIYQDIQGLSPRPQFVVGTGDYMFASTTGSEQQPQLNLYMQARNNYTGTVFNAMGNHECTGYTADNCTPGQTANYNAFFNTMVAPLGKSDTYYSVNINAPDNSWTSKLVVISCNVWSATQKTWLQNTLATPTTYTIVTRHEPNSASTAPCTSDVTSLMSQYPYNLSLVGHTHTFQMNSNEVIVGTGGAPISSSTVPYGFATVEKVAAGWQVVQYDYSSNLPVNTYTVP